MARLAAFPASAKLHQDVATSSSGYSCKWQMGLLRLHIARSRRIRAGFAHLQAARVACRRGGQWNVVFSLMGHSSNEQEPWEPDVKQSVVSYSLAVSVCQQTFKWSEALAILGSMLQRLVPPDVYSLTSAVKSCAFGGLWQRAAMLIHDMQEVHLSPNQVTYASFLSTLEQESQWQLVLDTLCLMWHGRLLLDDFCCSAATSTCTRSAKWHIGLQSVNTMQKKGSFLNHVSINAAINACGQGGLWSEAVKALHDMRGQRSCLDLVTCNAVGDGLASGQLWEEALRLLRSLPCLSFFPNEISFTSVMTALAACEDWQRALTMHENIRHAALQQNEVSFGASISLCEKNGQWSRALAVFRDMLATSVRPDLAITNAVLSACEVSGNWDFGVDFLTKSELMDRPRSPSVLLWSLARLNVRDPAVLHSALAEAVCDLRQNSHRPQQLSTLWWAGQMLGASSEVYTKLLTERSLCRLEDFTSEELAMSLWGILGNAGHDLLRASQEEWVVRIDSLLSKSEFSMQDWRSVRSHIFGSLWACAYVDMVSQSFRVAIQRLTLVAGLASDRKPLVKAISSPMCLHREPFEHVLEMQGKPSILSEIPDLFVLLKPPGWEVEPRSAIGGELNYRSLHSLLASREDAELAPILFDAEATFGFLHRLDVPSSGLLVCARTYEAYYALRVQLAAREILREYRVLSHGWVNEQRAEVRAQIYWRGGLPSLSGGQGKPSLSYLKVIRHGYLAFPDPLVAAVTVGSIRIATGRRHQIRCHLAHMGHPVCRDDTYSSEATSTFDRAWCPRNALHRCRIRFRDVQGVEREISAPLPGDLVDVLQHVRSRAC